VSYWSACKTSLYWCRDCRLCLACCDHYRSSIGSYKCDCFTVYTENYRHNLMSMVYQQNVLKQCRGPSQRWEFGMSVWPGGDMSSELRLQTNLVSFGQNPKPTTDLESHPAQSCKDYYCKDYLWEMWLRDWKDLLRHGKGSRNFDEVRMRAAAHMSLPELHKYHPSKIIEILSF